MPEEKITLGKWKGTVDTKKLKLFSGRNKPVWQQIHGGSREEIKGYMEEEIYFRGNMS